MPRILTLAASVRFKKIKDSIGHRSGGFTMRKMTYSIEQETAIASVLSDSFGASQESDAP
jgi:hypothetical protein